MSQFVQWSNFSKVAPYAELFRQGIVVTVLLSVFTVAIGFCIALILALMRMSNVRPFRALGLDKDGHMREGGPLVWISRFNPLSFLATAYVEILRSTPVIVQVFIIYYGVFGIVQLPSFQIFGFIKFSRFFPGCCSSGHELRRLAVRDHPCGKSSPLTADRPRRPVLWACPRLRTCAISFFRRHSRTFSRRLPMSLLLSSRSLRSRTPLVYRISCLR